MMILQDVIAWIRRKMGIKAGDIPVIGSDLVANKKLKTNASGHIITETEDSWHEVGASGEPAFQNSWTNWNASSDTTAGFTKVGNRVYIKGTIKSGANNTVAFTLPVGYRPLKHKQFPCLVWNNGWAPAGCHIASTGAVTIYFATMTHWFSINGIDFDINT